MNPNQVILTKQRKKRRGKSLIDTLIRSKRVVPNVNAFWKRVK